MKRLYYPILILIIGILLAISLLQPGWFTSHDGVYHILRSEEAVAMLKAGEFPLRWAGNLDEGFGIPLFNFIYPLPYYLTSLAIILGLSSMLSVKLVLLASYIAGGLGIYYFFKKKDRLLGLFLAIIYLATPYQFLNIFVRGALGEVVAMGLLPWILISFHDSYNRKAIHWYHPLPLAMLLISHNFLGIIFTAFLLPYLVFSKIFNKKTLSSLLLSVGLASFFLIPMLGERNLLYSFYHADFTFRFDQHFIYLRQFLYGKWDYWYSLPGPNDGMSFQLGIAQIVLVALAGLTTLLKKRSPRAIFLSSTFILTLFMMIQRSTPIWTFLPLLQVIQFPWRLLFMTTFLAPILGGIFLSSITRRKLRLTIMLLLTLLAFYNIRNYRRPMKFLSDTEYTDLYQLNLNHTTTTFRTEILPKWGSSDTRYKTDDVLVSSGNIVIEDIEVTPNVISFKANNKEEIGELNILRNYFPSWKILVDGKKDVVLPEPREDGTIRLMLLPGTHNYTISVKSTRVELFANLITLLTILYLLTLTRKKRIPPKYSH